MLVYVLTTAAPPRKRYTGASKDLARRLRQHNGELKGGARSTRGRKWKAWLTVKGFATWGECLSFERALKKAFRECRGERGRAVDRLCASAKWCGRGLEVEWV